MGIGPIPGSKIKEFGIEKGLEDDTLECFRVTIRAMDEVFIKWHSDEAEANRKK